MASFEHNELEKKKNMNGSDICWKHKTPFNDSAHNIVRLEPNNKLVMALRVQIVLKRVINIVAQEMMLLIRMFQ